MSRDAIREADGSLTPAVRHRESRRWVSERPGDRFDAHCSKARQSADRFQIGFVERAGRSASHAKDFQQIAILPPGPMALALDAAFEPLLLFEQREREMPKRRPCSQVRRPCESGSGHPRRRPTAPNAASSRSPSAPGLPRRSFERPSAARSESAAVRSPRACRLAVARLRPSPRSEAPSRPLAASRTSTSSTTVARRRSRRPCPFSAVSNTSRGMSNSGSRADQIEQRLDEGREAWNGCS